jgi:hypothetical protein
MKLTLIAFISLRFMVASPCCAADFRNLDFEQGDPTGLVPGVGAAGLVEKLMPAWSLFYLTSSSCAVSNVWVSYGDQGSLSDFVAALRFERVLAAPEFREGKYYVQFRRSLQSDPIWKLDQKGTIPIRSRFLVYRSFESEMQVEIDRQTISPLNRQGPFPPYGFSDVVTNLVYDIAAFAGQEVTLSLIGPFGYRFGLGGFIQGNAYVDSLRFVSQLSPVTVRRDGNQLVVDWYAAPNDYLLESTDSLSPGASWRPVPVAPVIEGDHHTLNISIEDKSRYYRLRIE